jgi:signal transduction histidine kinase
LLYFITGWCFSGAFTHNYARQTLLEWERARAQSEQDRANRFIVTVSHDLKQPLTALGFRLDMLKRKVSDNPALLGAVQQIEQQTVALDEMVRASFDLSRLNAGTWELNVAEVALPFLIEKVASEFRSTALEKGLSLDIRPVPPFLIRTDRDAMARILRNIIGNAIKYTPAKA